MSTAIKICIFGAGGRMGRAVAQAVQAAAGLQLVAAIEPAGSEWLGRDIGELAGIGPQGVQLSDDLNAALAACDVVIDFTRPAGTLALAKAMQKADVALVTGTTGFSAEEQAQLAAVAQTRAIVQAANFSIGVNLCVRLSEMAAKVMDDFADVEIIEAHHKHKVDAPSGTALRLGQAVAGATGRNLDTHAVKSRDGNIGEREERSIGFSTIRGGDIIGEHTVLFAADGERVEVTHKATSRMNFANGAVVAARWLRERAPGLYDMPEVLGLD